MDDTAQSRTSDAAASAATRKRRSSILKSQRPPRTPFCELEFNVCTPPDMTKSRRVSFSRRTGVAEFVTNEATTTWKNFYEEHNKSLESSGQESEANNIQQPIGTLGKRIFDQQFEEVEAVDFIGSLNNGQNFSTSINTINFAQLETTDTKLTAPKNNFELSAFTEQQSKLFSDDLAITCHGEVTDGIDVNFSAIQQIGEKDDLDEIQKDLEQQRNVCQGFFGRQNMSEYIEVDLDTTRVAMTNDESDMSITDTIHSPKVQDVTRSCSIEKKINLTKDWVADKENIVVNPYVAPRESQNFAINDEVLIFDGKKLVIRTESSKNENYRQTLLPNPSEQAPQRKTIVLNCNDDLPNFVDDAQASKNASGLAGVCEQKQSRSLDTSIPQPRLDETQSNHRTIFYNDHSGNISVTQAVPNIIPNTEKRRTILYENDTGNISITQAVPAAIIDKEKRKTILYENDNDISTTQAVPVNVVLIGENNQKRKTILFENEACNISMTQALPANIIIPDNAATGSRTVIIDDGTANKSNKQPIPNIVEKGSKEKRRTVAYEDDTGNISVTHVVASKLNSENEALPDRKTTIVIESNIGNISVTQALPSNIILPQKVNVTSYENDVDISMTQAIPTNILPGDKKGINRRRTVVFEDDTGNLSITQAVSANQVFHGLAYHQQRNAEVSDIVIATNEVLHINKVSANNTRTIIFEGDNGDISITKAVNLNQVQSGLINKQKEIPNDSPQKTIENRRRTIVFENDDADISMTQVVNVNQLLLEQNKEEKPNITDTELEIATNTALHNSNNSQSKRRTIMYDEEEKPVVQPISRNTMLPDREEKKLTINDMNSQLENINFLKQLDELATLTSGLQQDKISEVLNKKDGSYVEMPKANETKRKTFTYEKDNISTTQELLENFGSKIAQENTRPKVFDENAPLLSKPIPAELSTLQFEALKTSNTKYTEHEAMLVNLTDMAVDDILVYQTETTSKRKETEKNISQKTNAFPIEDDKAVSTLITDLPSEMSLELSPQDVVNGEQDEMCQATESELPKNNKNSTIATLVFERKNSILDDLLDMSQGSLGGEEDKSLMAKISSERQSQLDANQAEMKGDIFFITDNDEDMQIDKPERVISKELQSHELTKVPDESYYPPSMECEENPQNTEELPNKINEHKSALKNRSSRGQSSSPENLVGLHIRNKEFLDVTSKRNSKSFKTANDTKELLEMLSDLTEKRISRHTPLEKIDDIPEPESKVLEKKEKPKEPEPRRISIASKRQSIALSREDFLNNISMAGAALRMSRFELDESENPEDTVEETPQLDLSSKKNVNVSTGVVKTLHFEDDDSFCQKSGSHQTNTPLKKTAFGEVTYMKESKSKVIPDYAEVPDNIKTLMNDLVKPMADVLPYTTTKLGHGLEKVPSTCSTEIQANLLTSSQVDLQSEVYSNPESMYEMHKFSSVDFITEPTDRSVSQGLSSTANLSYSDKLTELDAKPEKANIQILRDKKDSSKSQARLVIFDQDNPLNNVLINPPLDVEPHRYNPISPDKPISDTLSKTPVNIESIEKINPSDKAPFVSNQYRLETTLTIPPTAPRHALEVDTQIHTNTCKPITDDKFSKAEMHDQKDTEVNTVIAMKGNDELLAASSSLTLVDDAIIHSKFDMKTDECHKEDDLVRESSLEHVYKLEKTMSEQSATEQLDSSLHLNNEIIEIHKPKKRTYSPKSKQDKHKECTLSSLEVTPKPAYKIQKRSFSPKVQEEPVGPRSISPTIFMETASPEKQKPAISPAMIRSVSPEKQIQSVKHTTQIRNDSHSLDVHSASPLIPTRSVTPGIKLQPLSPEMQSDVQAASDMIHKSLIGSEMKKQSVNTDLKRQSVSPEKKQSVGPKMRSGSPEMQKRSVSPTKQKLESCEYNHEKPLAQELKQNIVEKTEPTIQRSPKGISPRKLSKPGTVVTIQRVTTVGNEMEHQTDRVGRHSQTLPRDLDIPSSDTNSLASSKNLRNLHESFPKSESVPSESVLSESVLSESVLSESVPSESAQSHLKTDWCPKTSSSEISSKSSFDTDQDVFLKINSLLFMGSPDCEWESSAGDTWSFLLLHSRLRLSVRFACARVCADTPVLNVALETLRQDRKNPIAHLCVSFAADTIRYYIPRCGTARDLPSLVRRAGGAARVAARWARAVHAARARLAFALGAGGRLALKVANPSLRAVWEVTMQLELVVEDARAAPWPRAANVRVARLTRGAAPSPDALRRLLHDTPRDWGHVPRTVWKIFRYLKNKKTDDDEIAPHL